jgi:CheY-like chemotaxis protein
LPRRCAAAGFQNVRFTNNPLQALRSMEKRPAQILIADWLMPSIDGLELTRRVKKLDEQSQHFTYVMLLTARDDIEAMQERLRGRRRRLSEQGQPARSTAAAGLGGEAHRARDRTS